ncbi:MAG TPA: hypothetical protein VH985_19650 [Candidatus Binatia bacterium]
MKTNQFSIRSVTGSVRQPITTSFMDLLREITRLTKDDALVLEIVKRIFASHNVRLARTLAPVRLVGGDAARRTRIARSVLRGHI